jgi:AmmeMemoRadiSam system protein A
MSLVLTETEEKILLRTARAAIASQLDAAPEPSSEPSAALMTPCGAFVTLHERLSDGRLELRGCIGYIEAGSPLLETVRRAARAAAFHDGRFVPVAAAELPRLEIEISVLSPLAPVRDPAEIVVGEHGIVIRSGMRSGLLLPQVATERGWDRETFLGQTCLKAGLPRQAWKEPGVAIEIFSALVFNERDLGILENGE